jgi:hypothetical protein
MPEFSHAGGFVELPLELTVTCSTPGARIRFTTDCSDPGPDAPLYREPLKITKACCVRARAFPEGQPPGRIRSATFLPGERPALPLFCVVTDPDNLHGRETGLLRIAGGVSREERFQKKSFRVYFRRKYGPRWLEHPMFGPDGLKKFKCLRLRANANDQFRGTYRWTLMRDALSNELWKEAGGCTTDCRFALLALNGDLMGIYDIREHCNANHLRTKYGVEEPDLLKVSHWLDRTGVAVKDGDSSAWLELEDFIRDNDMREAENSAHVEERVDLDNLIDEHVFRLYGVDWDWPQNNRYMFRDRKAKSRWRFVMWDSEFSFALSDKIPAATNKLAHYLNSGDRHTLMFRKLFENPDFRRRFFSRLADMLNTTLAPGNVIAKIDAMAAEIAPCIPIEAGRWKAAAGALAELVTAKQWEANVEVLRRFARERSGHFFEHVAERFEDVKGIWKLRIGGPRVPGGTVLVNSVEIPPESMPWTGRYFHGIPVRLKAVPRPGHRFKGWTPSGFPKKAEIVLKPAPARNLFLVTRGSKWRYRDDREAPPDGWNGPDFDDASWSEGPALFGHGCGDERTALSSGKDTPACYFRKSFRVNRLKEADLAISLVVDDGAVVYLNGKEALRANMPGGRIDFGTRASAAIAAEDKSPWPVTYGFVVPRSLLKKGRNVVAVEVHQVSDSSSDVAFDLAMRFDAPVVAVTPVFEKTARRGRQDR